MAPYGSPNSDARRADYIGFLHRAPFAIDAYELGFAVGVREDYKLRNPYRSFEIPVQILDNDFRDADLDRYLGVLSEYQPDHGIIGDVRTREEAQFLVERGRDIQSELPAFTPIIVPKSHAALDAIPETVVVGYANGYSDVRAEDFSTPSDWSGRDVHILGGSPPKQWDVIERLTNIQQSLSAFSGGACAPANIVGLDWNGLHKVAYKGEYWHRESPHWRRADELSIRETVRRGLEEVREFWMERGVWPAGARGRDFDRIAVRTRPSNLVCAGCGMDVVEGESFDEDWRSVVSVSELESTERVAFCSKLCRDRFEYYGDCGRVMTRVSV